MLTVDPKKRATMNEIRHHAWTNMGYGHIVQNYLSPRPPVVPDPHPESIKELGSYGFKPDDAVRVLTTERGLHPIVSLYHLIDEARQRAEQEERNSAAAKALRVEQELVEAAATVVQQTRASLVGTRKRTQDANLAHLVEPAKVMPVAGRVTRAEVEKIADRLAVKDAAVDPVAPSSRPIRGFFQMHTTTQKTLVEACSEIERVLEVNDVQFTKHSATLYVCDERTNRFEIELSCQSESGATAAQYDLHVRRLRGNVWTHKRLVCRLLEEMAL
jgi:hypothetical protein